MTRIVFDEDALDTLFSSPDGPVGRHIRSKGLQVQRRAKRLAPVDTGRLRSSIVEELSREGDDLVERIGTDVEYALHQEKGTVRMPAHPYLVPALDAVRGGTP